jgi:hypothetical protein
MRGRKPRPLSVHDADRPALEQLARSRTRPYYQVLRARAILALAGGERVQALAFQMQCDPATVWRIARRYERRGLPGLLAHPAGDGRHGPSSRSSTTNSHPVGIPEAAIPSNGTAAHFLSPHLPDLAPDLLVEGAFDPPADATSAEAVGHLQAAV